jgi:hypothetical protein
MLTNNEKVICYIGPTLPIYQAVELAPSVIFRPPAQQGDILSDTVEVQPDRIILIDGEFDQSFAVWHKEIVFALSKGVKVYGASSMGALRAADLWRQGMVGWGQIYSWYKTGLTEDDSEVALLYSMDPKGNYHPLSVPIVDIRATLAGVAKKLEISLDHQEVLLDAAKAIHFTRRTKDRLTHVWSGILGERIAKSLVNNLWNQKAEDAIGLLRDYALLEPEPEAQVPTEAALSKFFWAQYDRDRRIKLEVGPGHAPVRIAQQHVCDYIALNSVDHHHIFWDARNFHLAHMLAQKLGVQVSEPEVNREHGRFCLRFGITSQADNEAWIAANNLTIGEFMILIIKMATVRKMQEWLSSSLSPMDSTKICLDYLKSHNSYTYWAKECAQKEAAIQEKGIDDSLSISPSESIEDQLAAHCQKNGLTIDGSLEDFVQESSFCSRYELRVALARLNAEALE